MNLTYNQLNNTTNITQQDQNDSTLIHLEQNFEQQKQLHQKKLAIYSNVENIDDEKQNKDKNQNKSYKIKQQHLPKLQNFQFNQYDQKQINIDAQQLKESQSQKGLQTLQIDFKTNMDQIFNPLKNQLNFQSPQTQHFHNKLSTKQNQMQNLSNLEKNDKKKHIIELLSGAKQIPLLIPMKREIDFEKLKNKQSNKKFDQNNDEQVIQNEQNCKICLESEQNDQQNGELLTPCQCAGTCKYIHEECLKEWIISKHISQIRQNKFVDFTKSNCEICNTNYRMNIDYGLKFSCKYVFSKRISMFSTFIVSLIFSVGLLYLIYFFSTLTLNNEQPNNNSNNNFSQNNQTNQTSTKDQDKSLNDSSPSQSTLEPGYKYGIIICSSIICFMFLIVLFLSIKETFFIKTVKLWKILNYQPLKDDILNSKILRNNQIMPINDSSINIIQNNNQQQSESFVQNQQINNQQQQLNDNQNRLQIY